MDLLDEDVEPLTDFSNLVVVLRIETSREIAGSFRDVAQHRHGVVQRLRDRTADDQEAEEEAQAGSTSEHDQIDVGVGAGFFADVCE